MRQEALAALVSEIARGPVETTVEQLVDRLGLESVGILGKIEQLRHTLEMYKIEVLPDLRTGEITTTRLLRFQSDSDALVSEAVKQKIARGESADLEFKETLLFHKKKAMNSPGLETKEYRSEEVQHAVLKSIAGFLNSGGGVLIVGLSDDQQVTGIEQDFCFPETSNADKWELHLRNCLHGKFKDGPAVADYVQVSIGEIDGKNVACIRVTRRGKLAVLRDPKGQNRIYRRQGNSTDAVDMADIEEFIESRNDGGRAR